MILPFCFVQDQCAHHAPAAPEASPEVLPGAGFGAPAFEAGGDDAGDHDYGVFCCYALGLQVEADGEGVVADGFAFMLL